MAGKTGFVLLDHDARSEQTVSADVFQRPVVTDYLGETRYIWRFALSREPRMALDTTGLLGARIRFTLRVAESPQGCACGPMWLLETLNSTSRFRGIELTFSID